MSQVDLDDLEAIAHADPSGMLQAALDLPTQARVGFELGRSLQGLPDGAALSAIVVCGMGGSGVGGDVARALYRDRLAIPFEVVKEPALPEFCGKDTLVVCSSYSGNTAETLSCFDQAAERGCRVFGIGSGGELARRAEERGVAVVSVPPGAPAPRAAFGSLTLGLLGALEAMGLVPPLSDDVAEAEQALGSMAVELAADAPGRVNPAKELAGWIGDRVAVVWGAEGLGAVAASRWKTELNENAKVPAFSAALPELDHNEIVGWSDGAGAGFALLALRHEGEDPDVAARFPASIEIAAEAGLSVQEVRARGESALARLLSLVMLGDTTSVYLGLARGFDPTPIEAIDRLKRVLEESGR